MFYSVGPLATAGKGIIGLENFFPCFPNTLAGMQETQRYTQFLSIYLFSEKPLPASVTLNNPTLKAHQTQSAAPT